MFAIKVMPKLLDIDTMVPEGAKNALKSSASQLSRFPPILPRLFMETFGEVVPPNMPKW